MTRDWKPGDPLDDWSGEDIDAYLSETSGPIPFPSRNVVPAQPVATSEPVALPYERPLADLERGAPGPLIADGLMVPGRAVTVVYGPGGVGKGHIACEAIKHLSAIGPVLIVDYEAHESEWGNRLDAMEVRDNVFYVVPKLQLPKETEAIREAVERTGAKAIVLDSYQAATPDGRVHAEQADVPREMFHALARIGVPALVLAHVTKSSGEHPPYPYGSVFVHSYARMTWSVRKLSQEDEPLRVELRNQKSNDRKLELPRVRVFTREADGRLVVTSEISLTHADAILIVLQRSSVPLSPSGVYSGLDWQDLLWDSATPEQIRQLLKNDKGGRFIRSGDGWAPRR